MNDKTSQHSREKRGGTNKTSKYAIQFHPRPAWVFIVYPFVSLLLVLSGCTNAPLHIPFQCHDAIGCVDISPGAPVKLAALYTLSGGSAPGGTEQLRTVQLTLSMHDNQFLGHPIHLQIEDELCTPEGGANGVLRILADPQSLAIFGTNCSNAATTASKAMSEKGLVMISGANTSAQLTSLGGKKGISSYPGYFRTVWNDAEMGRAAAYFAFQKLGITTAAVVNANDAYSKGLTDIFSQSFSELGGKIVLDTSVDEDDPEQHPMLNAVALSGAKLIFFPLSHPETGSRIIRQSKDFPALQNIVFIGGEAMLSNTFIQDVGEAGLGVYIPGPANLASPENDKLREQYRQKFGEEPPSFYYSFTYDAVNLLLGAIEKSTARDQDGTLHIGRQAIRDALYATKNFNGVSGHLKCDAFGDCSAAKLNIMRLDHPDAGIEGLRSNVIYVYSPQ